MNNADIASGTTTRLGSRTVDATKQCLLCRTELNLTVEHIVPQTLWRRFDINPNQDHLATFRTTLCDGHNKATSVLHERTEMLDLISEGEPVNRRTLEHLGDWALWVTLLLALERGSGVLGETSARQLLSRRFDDGQSPRGFRVYAARVSEYIEPRVPARPSHALALAGDDRVYTNASGVPVGYSVRTGPIKASESIGLVQLALLVVGPTLSSGKGHLERVDLAAASIGLERVRPLPDPLPQLEPREVSMSEVSKLFTVMPFGTEMSLMPEMIRVLVQTAGEPEA